MADVTKTNQVVPGVPECDVPAAGRATAGFAESVLYHAGEHGYNTHRIPALLATNAGTILAFSEGRRFTGGDSDQVDLLVRRSTDGGRAFEPMQIVAAEDGWVSGNPAPVQDRETGTIWLLFCRNPRDERGEHEIVEGRLPRTVWITSSDDDGQSWTDPTEISDQVKRPSWSWYATGPCHGIQLQCGRLVVPCDHVEGSVHDYEVSGHSHVIYSDDHGSTWRIGGSAQAGTNESVVVQTQNGSLYLSCRNYASSPGTARSVYRRAYAWSNDRGASFGDFGMDETLVEPICQASMIRMTSTTSGADRNRVLFCNPAGVKDGDHVRSELTIRLSYDECSTWPVARVLCAGRASYSDLCITLDGTVCCLYEKGPDRDGGESELMLARFDLEWLQKQECSVASSRRLERDGRHGPCS